MCVCVRVQETARWNLGVRLDVGSLHVQTQLAALRVEIVHATQKKSRVANPLLVHECATLTHVQDCHAPALEHVYHGRPARAIHVVVHGGCLQEQPLVNLLLHGLLSGEVVVQAILLSCAFVWVQGWRVVIVRRWLGCGGGGGRETSLVSRPPVACCSVTLCRHMHPLAATGVAACQCISRVSAGRCCCFSSHSAPCLPPAHLGEAFVLCG